MTTTTKATRSRLAATNEGTHGGPGKVRVYLLSDGTYETARYHGDAHIGSEFTPAYPTGLECDGRLRHLKDTPA